MLHHFGRHMQGGGLPARHMHVKKYGNKSAESRIAKIGTLQISIAYAFRSYI